MKVILIGATGVIGKNILRALGGQERSLEIITVSRKGPSDLLLDISSASEIKSMFEQVGPFDALICAAGDCYMGPFEQLTEEQLYVGIKNKMMGQINLVLLGKDYIKPGGSFTLTSGFLSDDPIKGAISYSMVNGAIESFVYAATIELQQGIRINAVSPGLVVEQEELAWDAPTRGQLPVAMNRVVQAYCKSAFGYLTGQVFRVWESSTQWVRK
jgi:NAD(P)-dependent dehydrogenase (short-subunit alcohol dehydrogenase family)